MTNQSSTDAYKRSLFGATGRKASDLEKIRVGIVNSHSELVPGHAHLDELSALVKKGVRAAGGAPFEFRTIAICDGIVQGAGMHAVLPSREIIAASVELTCLAYDFDALVMVGSCDKILPGMLMAAARLGKPVAFLTGGLMKPGTFDGRRIVASDVKEAIGKAQKGELTADRLRQIEKAACPGPGICNMMGTANTMACLIEGAGLSMPGNATTEALGTTIKEMAVKVGKCAVALVKSKVRFSDQMRVSNLYNLIRIGQSFGGSTNMVLHLIALSLEIGSPIGYEDFDRIGKETPLLARFKPASELCLSDFEKAGGISTLLSTLSEFLDVSIQTIEGGTLADRIGSAKEPDGVVIHSPEDPIEQQGGIAALYGTLAPQGALVKTSGVDAAMRVHTGPAKVFECEEDVLDVLAEGGIEAGDVIVIRNEGPKGGPGMREMSIPAAVMVGMGLSDKVAMVTDGRFSGATRGSCIGYLCPEAALGGPIALVKNGDPIRIDIPNRSLDLLVSEEEIDLRKNQWKPPQKKSPSGFLDIYSQMALPATKGAGLDRTHDSQKGRS